MIYRLMFSWMIVGVLSSSASADELDASPFVMAHDCVEKGRKLCVLGVVPEGTEVALLSNNPPTVCLTRAIKVFTQVVKGNEVALTELDSSRCSSMPFTFAFMKPLPNLQYSTFGLTAEKDQGILSKVDKAIRAQTGKINDPQGQHKTRISTAPPAIHALPVRQAYLAVYANELVSGAKTLVYYAPNGTVSKIIGIGETQGGLIVNNIAVLRIKYDCRGDCMLEHAGIALVSLEAWGISQMF